MHRVAFDRQLSDELQTAPAPSTTRSVIRCIGLEAVVESVHCRFSQMYVRVNQKRTTFDSALNPLQDAVRTAPAGTPLPDVMLRRIGLLLSPWLQLVA